MARVMKTDAAAVGTSPVTLFTVAAGERHIVRHIRVHNTSGSANTVTVSGNGGEYASGMAFSANSLAVSPAAGCDADYYGSTCFEATDTLTAVAGAASVDVIVDYERVILG